MTTDAENVPELPAGVTGEQILALMMPLVIRSTSDAASSSREVAAALQHMEGRLATFESALALNTTAVTRLADLRQREITDKRERGSWLRSVLTPQVVITALLIIAGYLGIYFKPPPHQQAPHYQQSPVQPLDQKP